MPCTGSQSNSSKPEPSSRQSLALPPAQLAWPGRHVTQPSTSTQLWPWAAQSVEPLNPPLPSQARAVLPSQANCPAWHRLASSPVLPAPPSLLLPFAISGLLEQEDKQAGTPEEHHERAREQLPTAKEPRAVGVRHDAGSYSRVPRRRQSLVLSGRWRGQLGRAARCRIVAIEHQRRRPRRRPTAPPGDRASPRRRGDWKILLEIGGPSSMPAA